MIGLDQEEAKYARGFVFGSIGAWWVYLGVAVLPDALGAAHWLLAARALLAFVAGIALCALCVFQFRPEPKRNVYGGARFENDLKAARHTGLEGEGRIGRIR